MYRPSYWADSCDDEHDYQMTVDGDDTRSLCHNQYRSDDVTVRDVLRNCTSGLPAVVNGLTGLSLVNRHGDRDRQLALNYI
ncbi:hypothetical protein J6590_069913 [Homalodisca vitripennis]|nr:hypothetical protein J6590_069913 [Homalodisca vitripennis]